MSGLVFLLAALLIAAVVVWSILNDKVPPTGRTRWLFAMKDEEEEDPEQHGRRRPDGAARSTGQGETGTASDRDRRVE